MEHLYNWVFTYNPHTEKWVAVEVEHLSDYKNDYDTPYAIKSSKMPTLIEMVVRSKGSLEIMKKIYKF